MKLLTGLTPAYLKELSLKVKQGEIIMKGNQTTLDQFKNERGEESDEQTTKSKVSGQALREAYMPYNGPAYCPQKDDLHGL